MKRTKPVCLLCRHTLATSGTRNGLALQAGRQPRASFSAAPSTRNTAPSSQEESQRPRPRRQIRDFLEQQPPARPEKQGSTIFPNRSANIDALFHQILTGQKSSDIPEHTTAAHSSSMELSLAHIGRLQEMLESGESDADAYAYLKSDVYPAINQLGAHAPQVFYKIVSKLMAKICEEKRENMLFNKLPPVSEILLIYADIGEMKPQLWAGLVGDLVRTLLSMSPRTDDYPSIEEYEKHLEVREDLLDDLVESWKVLSMPKSALFPKNNAPAKLDGDGEMHDGFWLPTVDRVTLEKIPTRKNFLITAVSRMFPQYQFNQTGGPAVVLAIATYALLLDPVRSNAHTRRSAIRFISRVSQIISAPQVKDAAVKKLVQSAFPDLDQYIMSEWPRLKAQARRHSETKDMREDSRKLTPTRGAGLSKVSTIDAASLGRRLSQAYGTRNVGAVQQLWREFSGDEKSRSESQASEMRKHEDLIDSFININMALNQADKALLVWNTMLKVGLKPSLKTWNVMLDGCKKGKNVNAIKNIWTKLVASGFPLDTAIWTTRVSGLIESGDYKGGIEALEEMEALWRNRTAKAVKPTIEPVNAALAGFVRAGKVATAEKILAWAGRHGIHPDIFTFNTLLRPMVRSAQHDAVHQIFEAMKASQVKPDAATFTIMLDAAYANCEHSEPEVLNEMIGRVLKELRAAGLELNLQVFGKMIYLLLQGGDRNKDAVKAVLACMWSEGYELSPHIYTMLVEHYFSRSPPDLAAVESLLKRRRLLDYDDMDHIFYDRIIKGYALAGNTSAALEIYYRLSEVGHKTSLSTQAELVNALLQQDKRESARDVVHNTRRLHEEAQRGRREHGEGGDDQNLDRYWRHSFWHLARRYGLLEGGQPGTKKGESWSS